jgi:hypothetical protein
MNQQKIERMIVTKMLGSAARKGAAAKPWSRLEYRVM